MRMILIVLMLTACTTTRSNSGKPDKDLYVHTSINCALLTRDIYKYHNDSYYKHCMRTKGF